MSLSRGAAVRSPFPPCPKKAAIPLLLGRRSVADTYLFLHLDKHKQFTQGVFLARQEQPAIRPAGWREQVENFVQSQQGARRRRFAASLSWSVFSSDRRRDVKILLFEFPVFPVGFLQGARTPKIPFPLPAPVISRLSSDGDTIKTEPRKSKETLELKSDTILLPSQQQRRLRSDALMRKE